MLEINETWNDIIGKFILKWPFSSLELEINLIMDYFDEHLEWELKKQEQTELVMKFVGLFLNTRNIGLSDITNAKIINAGVMIFITEWGTFSFDLNANKFEDFFRWNEEAVYAERFKLSEEMSNTSELLDSAVDAMDHIFKKNENEWFDELENEDVLKTEEFWKHLKDKNLKEISRTVKNWLFYFDILSEKYKSNHEANNKVLKTKERFLAMVMWIWDKYEGAVEYLEKTAEETLLEWWLLEDIVKQLSVEELLLYVRESNKQMDRNNYQSTPVGESYNAFSTSLNKFVFKKLTIENASDEHFLEFAKIISWKEETYRPEWMWGEAWVDDSLKSEPKNMEVLNDIVMYLATKKGGIMEKVNTSKLSQLEDEQIWNKDTYKIVQDFSKILSDRMWYTSESSVRQVIKYLWYFDILNIQNWQKYSSLTLEQKAKVSVIYRVTEKLTNSHHVWKHVYDEGLVWTNYKYSGEYHPWNNNLSFEDLSNVFSSVAVNSSEKMVEQMTDIFQKTDGIGEYLWGKDAEQFWLKNETDIKIFNFFKDFQWIGAFDFSDRSISNIKTTTKFAAVIATAIFAIPVTVTALTLAWASTATIVAVSGMWALTQWAIMWATASVASIAINPKGYDSIWEGVFDITTDIILWAVTWLIWWYIVVKNWVEYFQNTWWKRVLLTSKLKRQINKKIKNATMNPSKYWEAGFKLNKAIFTSDLIFLGLFPEAGRMKLTDWLFHEKSIFSEKAISK
jgi:hypothetical protein